jgi:enoyl-CoA hydratase
VRVVLDRAGRRNALDLGMAATLLEALEAEPSAVVLLGSRDPSIFCAGADLDIPDGERSRLSDLLYQCCREMVARPGPVVAVIEGAAVGGGAHVASAADLRVAGPGARFRWLGPGHGLAVGAWVLPDLVGRGRALELMLTSRWVDATEARAMGLVGDVVDDPWAHAEEMARRFAGLDPEAVARTKTIASSGDLLERLDAERRANHGWSGSVRRP